MKTIKIIDLLNKIANGEEVPKKIKYKDWLYEFEKDCNDYICEYDSLLYRENDDVRQFLNDKVEIIEEEKKIPEKLGLTAYVDGEISYSWSKSEAVLKTRINEIIDYLHYLKNKGE